jgi:hypothetical protein
MLEKERLCAIIMPRTMAKKLAKKFALPLNKAISVCNLNFKRLTDKGILTRVKKGIYCCKVETVFGSIKPDSEQLAAHMLIFKDGKIIGYNTGADAINRLGFSTQMPRYVDIVSNNYRTRLPKGCLVRAHKSVTKINNKNWKYLEFLDILDIMHRFSIDATDPEAILKNYVKFHKLDAMTLIKLAGKYYSKKTILRLVRFLAA